jgi:hypothetical protein
MFGADATIGSICTFDFFLGFICNTPIPSSALSAITAATAINTIDHLNNNQTWNWSTATTQSPMTMTANTLDTGSILNMTTSNASVNSINGLLNVANTGASTSGVLARFQANSTAGSGMTMLTSGNVGIGLIAPASKLDVNGNVNATTITLSVVTETAACTTTGAIAVDSSGNVLSCQP